MGYYNAPFLGRRRRSRGVYFAVYAASVMLAFGLGMLTTY